MKIVVIGGSGLIGKKLVSELRAKGDEVTPASPSSGVDILTGAGLAEALKGADVVVDVVNSPSFEDSAVLSFFERAAANLLPAEAAAGVRHHVALSVVGAERLPTSGYMRAKIAQEAAIKAGGVPYTIVRATQFFEFIGAVADSSTSADKGTVHLPTSLLQPIASDDVVAALASVAHEAPASGTLEIAGPEALPLDELARRLLAAKGDPRRVIADEHATYFGARLDDHSLTPGNAPRLGKTRFEDWLRRL